MASQWRVTAQENGQRFTFNGNVQRSAVLEIAKAAEAQGLSAVRIEARTISPWLDETEVVRACDQA